ncbi:MAG TPA: GNAT family N-acetyltransferase [Stellaceae bacterium]|nr:GNAT family N-acetyltransferase [Stellaceae bacterium]
MATHAELVRWRAEEAAVNGFPALRVALLQGWLLRFSGGTRRTANSATPLRGASANADDLVEPVEALYRQLGQPAIFRIPSFLDPCVDAALAARGYTMEGTSCVIFGDVRSIASAALPAQQAGVVTRVSSRASSDWFARVAAMQGQTGEQAAVYRRIVGSITLPVAFAETLAAHEIVAAAFGIVHNGLLCFESVVTDSGHRRRGHARRNLAALAQWALEAGATGASLQVEAPNAPARALYQGIGLTTELHRYHYRRQPA